MKQQGEEESDDILDLGVTDALDDDLEGEECEQANYYQQQQQDERHFDDNEHNSLSTGDLREKLQRSSSLRDNNYNGQTTMDEEECEESGERRIRFQNERIIVAQKMNNEIPDSLENVVTAEQQRPFRGRGRGRGMRGLRGGRFAAHHQGMFNQR